ncbi:MAG: putative metal-dependent HD superfamily phosphohydrolase [Saprospiraceae bacterium]|jgi:predicted metal-dependent HD superfamily phosphohydrolase
MTKANRDILDAAQTFVTQYFKDHISAEYVYHDFQHTMQVLEGIRKLGEASGLPENELILLELAGWFHDTGYKDGPENHEARGCMLLRDFMADYDYAEEELKMMEGCIMATKLPQTPKHIHEEIICDADLAHLGNEYYWDRTGRVRQELMLTRGMMMSEQEWIDFEIDFMLEHCYHTAAAESLYGKRKLKHIKQLRKQRLRLNPIEVESVEALRTKDKNKKKKKSKPKKVKEGNGDNLEINEIRIGRGVETMYRTTYRTHVNLSSIADNKANIMLSINAIVISIILPQLLPKFSENPRLILPTIIMLSVCLIAMIFATLSTRPKITEGKIARKDIEERKGNLLFFGNYYKMTMDDFHWGMMEMIRDSDYLYSTMTRDLYFLGIVLAKKYRYLSICYGVFMYGMVISVLAFAIAFLAI